MNELKTLQEGDKNIIRDFVDEYHRTEYNFDYDGDCEAIACYWIKIINQERQKAFTLGLMKGVESNINIGDKVTYSTYDDEYVVVGLSQMIYDEDCAGEPEWKITNEIQEVAIAKYYPETSYQKPSWVSIKDVYKLKQELK